MTDRPVAELILKDVFEGIAHYYGEDAVDQIARFALLKNRSRESNRVMDELERTFLPNDRQELKQ